MHMRDHAHAALGVPPLLGSGLQRPAALRECSMASGYGLPNVMIDDYHYYYSCLAVLYEAMCNTGPS